jgi:RNA polymerase sigma factor for flagellar operon FliA
MRLVAAGAVDQRQRDELVMSHVDLVRAMATRLSRRLPPQVETAELVSVGVMGLIDAATRFQPSLGVPFDAFARRRIHGAMLDALRRLDWVPRAVRERRRAIDGAIGRLRNALGREPESAEIARILGVSSEQYAAMLDEIRAAALASVRPSPGAEGEDLLDVAVEDGPNQHTALERRELRTWLARALAELPERDRQILALYSDEELTLAEIGQVIGVGESRVSQLRTQAIARLRSRLHAFLEAGHRN